MAVRVPWDEEEVLLLLDAYDKICAHPEYRKELTQALSTNLRRRATEQGVQIDETFRSVNGIGMRFLEVEEILYPKERAFGKPSELLCSTVELYKDHRRTFLKKVKELDRYTVKILADLVGFSEMEAVVLLDGYLNMAQPGETRAHTARLVSAKLRALALNTGCVINDGFRSEIGINGRLRRMEEAFSSYDFDDTTLPEVFIAVVTMYRTDQRTYKAILKEANRLIGKVLLPEDAEKLAREKQKRRDASPVIKTKYVRTKKERSLRDRYGKVYTAVYDALERRQLTEPRGVTATDLFRALKKKYPRKDIMAILDGVGWASEVREGKYVLSPNGHTADRKTAKKASALPEKAGCDTTVQQHVVDVPQNEDDREESAVEEKSAMLSIPWDEYEAVLLLNAYFAVEQGLITREKEISQLSVRLRQYLVNSGKFIDSNEKDENVLDLMLKKIAYLVTAGQNGLSGAIKLFQDTLRVYCEDQETYKKRLKIALEKSNIDYDYRAKFEQWTSEKLSAGRKKLTLDGLAAIESYCRARNIMTRSIYRYGDPAELKSIRGQLESNKAFKIAFRKDRKEKIAALNEYIRFIQQFDKSIITGLAEEPIAAQAVLPQHPVPYVAAHERIEEHRTLHSDKKPSETAEQPAGFKQTAETFNGKAERPASDTPLRRTLIKTVRYLQTRYDVREAYNYADKPDSKRNDILYKAARDRQDIMWVYYTEGPRVGYVSIETEPACVAAMGDTYPGFFRAQLRDMHPCLKLFCTDYDAIAETLVTICNSIDDFFGGNQIKIREEIVRRLSDVNDKDQTLQPIKVAFNGKEKQVATWGEVFVWAIEQGTLMPELRDRTVGIFHGLEENLALNQDLLPGLKRILTNFGVSPDAVEVTCVPRLIVPSEPAKPKKPASAHKPVVVPAAKQGVSAELVKAVEKAALKADEKGITTAALAVKLHTTEASVKEAAEVSRCIVQMPEYLRHVDSFIDWEEGAELLADIMEKRLAANDGYVSAAQLYEYACADMHMFLNDNDMEDQKQVYKMAEYLFGKVGYRDLHLVFTNYQHISRAGEEQVQSMLELCRKFGREKDGVFTHAELEEYLKSIGAKTGNLREQMKVNKEPIFLYYEDAVYMTAESIGIDDAWLEKAKRALDVLFDDVGDHIVLRKIEPVWYAQLPELPGGRAWTPLLLQSILRFYSKQLGGAHTVSTGAKFQSGDTLHVMLASGQSEISTFADAVAAMLIDNEIEEREFETGALRQLIVQHDMIKGGELSWTLADVLSGDERFAWTADKSHVKVLL